MFSSRTHSRRKTLHDIPAVVTVQGSSSNTDLNASKQEMRDAAVTSNEDSANQNVAPTKTKNSSSTGPIRFFDKFARSQSSGSLRISVAPFPTANRMTVTSNSKKVEQQEDNHSDNYQGNGEDIAAQAGCTPAYSGLDSQDESVPTVIQQENSNQGIAADAQETTDLASVCDVFLNASIQLLHIQSDARQRIRQLWFLIQRLRWENHLSDAGVDLLHRELLSIIKGLNMEKLEGARHLKSGFLTLVQAPPIPGKAPTVKTLFGGRQTLGQRMWCTLSEDQAKLEMVPVRDDVPVKEEKSGFPPSPTSTATHSPSSSSTPPTSTASTGTPVNSGGASALGNLSSKFKLTNSLAWLLNDTFESSPPEAARSIKLHGCQVRKLPCHNPSNASDGTTNNFNVRHQFQLLVPSLRSGDTHWNPGDSDPCNTSYGIYVFEVSTAAGGEQEVDAWMDAIDRVCMFHLYMLERTLRRSTHLAQYRDVLSRHFPICISLSWLRNRIDRYDPRQSSSGWQQHVHQHQQVQRRSSINLSMIQIIKDLERDKVLVDHRLITARTSSSPRGTEQANISEVVKYIVMKVMDFAAKTSDRSKSSLQTQQQQQQSPTSQTNRFTKYSEAKALAFVERVLRGSSRTQSGGDIYDAISFFCQHERVSICPVSHDAFPVQMNISSDEEQDVFQVEVRVCMRFKVVELTPPSSPRANDSVQDWNRTDENLQLPHPDGLKEWAILEGTLSRQFTLGKLSESGYVTIDYVREVEDVETDPGINIAA